MRVLEGRLSLANATIAVLEQEHLAEKAKSDKRISSLEVTIEELGKKLTDVDVQHTLSMAFYQRKLIDQDIINNVSVLPIAFSIT
jgi:uncharacterized protein YaeQ